MKVAIRCTAIGLLTAAMLLGGCRRGGRAVNVVGSTSVQPFAEMLSQEFQKLQPGPNVEVQGGGSTAGIQAVTEGIAQIGMCSRNLKDSEAAYLQPIVIAQDGLAIVVHKSNPVTGLTRAQIRDIFRGQIVNWKQAGGDDRPIRLITREEGSGTREAFTKLVMEFGQKPKAGEKPLPVRIARKALTQESNGAVKELVKHDPAAIGYMSLGLVGDELKKLRVDGAEATVEAVSTGRYALVRPFLFVVQGEVSPRAQAFIDFVRSPQGQDMLQKEGLVRAPGK